MGWQRIRHAQTQAQKVKNCMLKIPNTWLANARTIFFLVLCGSGFFASKREMALGASLGRSHTRGTSRLCSHSRGSWIPALSLGCYHCFLLSAHFLCLDTHLFWKEILIPRSHESDMVVMFTVIRTVF